MIGSGEKSCAPRRNGLRVAILAAGLALCAMGAREAAFACDPAGAACRPSSPKSPAKEAAKRKPVPGEVAGAHGPTGQTPPTDIAAPLAEAVPLSGQGDDGAIVRHTANGEPTAGNEQPQGPVTPDAEIAGAGPVPSAKKPQNSKRADAKKPKDAADVTPSHADEVETVASVQQAMPAEPAPRKRKQGSPAKPSPETVQDAEPGVPGVAGFRTDLEAMKPEAIKAIPAKGVPKTLSTVVLKAIYDSALIKASEGGAMDALASIGVAEANLYPQIEGRIGMGPSAVGDWQAPGSPGKPYFNTKKTYGAARADALLTGTQLLYDFGATRSNIAKNAAATEAQNWNVLTTVEDVAYRASDAYLKVLQARALMQLADDNLKTLQDVAALVVENQRNGNGTVADVKRVNGRLVEAGSTRADEELALKLASDQLRRLIRVDPGPLAPVPTLGRTLPSDEAKALAEGLKVSPRIRAYKASIESREAEIAYLKNGAKPKISADLTAGNKQYQAVNDKTSLDATAFLTLSYKFADGGLVSSQIEQARARVFQDEMRMRDESETMENELRQAYFTIKIARGKMESLAQGVDDNVKARALYREQFAGGKRSLLELLEVQNAYYVAKRTQIVNLFEEQRATFSVLRSLGKLAVTAIRSR